MLRRLNECEVKTTGRVRASFLRVSKRCFPTETRTSRGAGMSYHDAVDNTEIGLSKSHSRRNFVQEFESPDVGFRCVHVWKNQIAKQESDGTPYCK